MPVLYFQPHWTAQRAVVPGRRGASHCKGAHHFSPSLCLPSPLLEREPPKGAGDSHWNMRFLLKNKEF